MSEINTRRTVVDNLRELGIDCQRIEDGIQAGIPDLNFCREGCEGWLEFKWVDGTKLPKRATTPVRIGLRPEQALWLNTRQHHGGRVAVLTKISERNLWLLHTRCFTDLRDGMILTELITSATLSWYGAFKPMVLQVLNVVLERKISLISTGCIT